MRVRVYVEQHVEQLEWVLPVHVHPLQGTELCAVLVPVQLSAKEVSSIPGPITAEGPSKVPGQSALTQDLSSGPLVNESYETRGFK